MRSLLTLLLLAPVAVAQTPAEKKATIAYIESLRDKDTGAFKVTPDGKPSLRACNGAAKALHNLGGEVRDKDKVQKFVLSCYDPKTGTFAEPGTKANVISTAIGVITACAVDTPHDKFKGAMDYLGQNAKEFEDVRLAAAAVEAWGVKDCPFDFKPWQDLTFKYIQTNFMNLKKGGAREMGSAAALGLRLDFPFGGQERAFMINEIQSGQMADGGWGKSGAKASDIETTYRVMRALMLLKSPPKDVKKLREFLASHRNKDGGYATEPGKPSSMSGVYYNTTIAKWLDEMEKK